MKLRNIISSSNDFRNEEDIILRDYLALERTKMANERTLLSYIRSSLYLLLGGIGIIQLDGFEGIHFLGYIALGLTVLLVLIGVYRFNLLKKNLKNYYAQIDQVK